MKNKNILVQVIFALTLIGLIAVGCSSHNKMSSPSRTFYKKAKDQQKQGLELEAIYSASSGVLADPKFEDSKTFLYTNFDNTMSAINQELPKYKNTTDTTEAKRQLYIYKRLVDINGNIAKMNLPLKQHKGKWSWTTEVKDYTVEADSSRKIAYTVYYNLAKKLLYSSTLGTDVTNAHAIFVTGHNRYTTTQADERKKSHVKIADELCNYADTKKDAAIWDETILAAWAFHCAKKYDTDTTRAAEGLAYTKPRVSEQLVEDGQKLTKQGDTKSLLLAHSRYEAAINWNKDNEQAAQLKEAIKEKIAESYYREAVSMRITATSEGYTSKIDLLQNALAWMPNYKDAQALIFNLEIKDELLTLEKNIAQTETEYNKVNEDVRLLSEGVDYTQETMEKITYVSDNMRSISNTAKSISKAIGPLCGLPAIGTVLSVTNKSLTTLRQPVNNTVTYFTKVEKPIITPTKNTVEKTKILTDNVKGKMDMTALTISCARITIGAMANCIDDVNEEDALKVSALAIKQLNTGLVELNNQLSNFNNGMSGVKSASKNISDITSFINPVEEGIKAVKPVVDKIGAGANEINKVLNKNVAGYSIRDALKLTGPLKYIFDKAMGFLDPVLEKFSNSLPQIPGTDELMAEVDKLKEKNDVLTKEVDKLNAKYEKYSDVQGLIISNLNTLVAKTGCGKGVPISEK